MVNHTKTAIPIDASSSAYERSVTAFRADPDMRGFVEKNYFDEDLSKAVARYTASEEHARTLRLISAHVPQGGLVLDIGAGRGLTSLALARSGYHVISIDEDNSPLVGITALAHHLSATPEQAISPIRGNILELAFPKDTFDVVFCRSVLHHLTNLETGLKEVYRVLKSGGVFVACNEHIISVFSDGARFHKNHPAVKHGVDERAYPACGYARRCRKAGFRKVGFFGNPLDYHEFLSASERNRIRARLIALPIVGRPASRVLHKLHVLKRAYLSVPEERLVVTSIIGFKTSNCSKHASPR